MRFRRRSAAFVRHEGHEAGPLDRFRDGVLARGLATGLTTADNPAMTIGQLAEQIQILVIDEHRTWANAIDANGILFGNLLIAAAAVALALVVIHRFFWIAARRSGQ